MNPATRCASDLTALLDSMDQGVLLFDASGTLRSCNNRAAQLFGVEPAALQRCESLDAIIELLRPRLDGPEESAARWRELRANPDEAVWDEVRISQPPRVLERFARPVYTDSNRPSGWLELYRDVTAERAFQSRLLHTDRMAALGQLVAGIAHELNNPLTSIMGYAQLLAAREERSGPEASRQPSDRLKIFNEAERARRIVKNLLIFARQAEPERVAVDLNEIVQRTLALRSYELHVENIVVELELTPELPETMADPHQLQQVLLNLLVNAEHALQQQSGTRRIWIRTRTHLPNRLVVEVADNGPGVPPEIATRIFDPFFTTKPAGVGTGLGLSIAYGVVKEHGGDISMQRRRQPGACFVIELPIVAPNQPAERAWSPRERHAALHKGAASRRILVVEDEPTVAQLIRDVMSEAGHQVETLDDSRLALQRILQAQPPLDLIICDLKMPQFDGPALHRALVARRHPARDRILFVTGDTLSRRTMEFLESSRVPYLAKPFLVEELKQAVEERWQAELQPPPQEPRPRSRVRRNSIPFDAVTQRQERTRPRK